MHAQLKEAVGEPFARGYCPLDLFSPNPQRIYKAATSLWNSWIESNASINNLRIFIDGEIVKPTVRLISSHYKRSQSSL
jgi:inositol-pentakisphosphate 2-kinase